jgi:hypothetical protein
LNPLYQLGQTGIAEGGRTSQFQAVDYQAVADTAMVKLRGLPGRIAAEEDAEPAKKAKA